jgi:hypothetical protein
VEQNGDRQPNEAWLQQGKDDAQHILRAFVPIAAGQAAKRGQKGAGVGSMVGQFFEITPAPYHMTHTAEQQRQAEAERKVEPTPLHKKAMAK